VWRQRIEYATGTSRLDINKCFAYHCSSALGRLLGRRIERFDPRIDVGDHRCDAIAAMAERCLDKVLAGMAGRNPGADSVVNPNVIGQK
jgi:hypothetical protein